MPQTGQENRHRAGNEVVIWQVVFILVCELACFLVHLLGAQDGLRDDGGNKRQILAVDCTGVNGISANHIYLKGHKRHMYMRIGNNRVFVPAAQLHARTLKAYILSKQTPRHALNTHYPTRASHTRGPSPPTESAA